MSQAGVDIQAYNDFMLGTSAVSLTGPQGPHNFANYRSYILDRYKKGNRGTRTLQGGSAIEVFAMFDEKNTAEDYSRNQQGKPLNPQVIEKMTGYWRYVRDHAAWDEAEVLLNAGAGREAMAQQWVDDKWVKDMRLATSLCNKMEDDLHRKPNFSEMEQSGGVQRMSLMAINNEYDDGLPYDEGLGGPWTSFMGKDSTGVAGWAPQRASYAQSVADAAAAAGGVEDWDLFHAFDDMEILLHFENLPGKEQFARTTSGQFFIRTNREGRNQYKRGARASNDHLRFGPHDAGVPHAKFNGIDIVYVAALDTAPVYPTDGTSAAPQAWDYVGAGASGPRYHWDNGDTGIVPVWHSTKHMQKLEPMNDQLQPESWVMWCVSWGNIVSEERRVNGTVYPSADI